MVKRLGYVIIVMTALSASVVRGEQVDPFFFPGAERTSASSSEALTRDPFTNPFNARVPEPSRTRKPRKMALSGIIHSEKSGVVIINGETFRKSETVGQRVLVEINRKSVVLKDKSGRTEELFLDNKR